MKRLACALLLVVFACPRIAPARSAYDKPPPGRVVQTANLNFGGKNAKQMYAAVVSRELLPTKDANGKTQYQTYLTIYRRRGQAETLAQIYQSPSTTDYLKLVPRRVAVPNAPGLWLPGIEVNIVGTAALMEPDAQQLVVKVYSYAADCGRVTIHVLRLNPKTQNLQGTLQVQNPCNLDGSVNGRSLELTGPYYASDAPLCCPTKNKAEATVRFDSAAGRWSIVPRYFKLIY